MDKTCSNIFSCAGYADPTLDDRSGIFYALIDTNNVINPITYPSFDSVNYESLVIFVDEGANRQLACPPITNCQVICNQRRQVDPGECFRLVSDFSAAQNGMLMVDSREMRVLNTQLQPLLVYVHLRT